MVPKVDLSIRLLAGNTEIEKAPISLFQQASQLTTTGFHVGVTAKDLFGDGGRLGLSISQPLRVESGVIGMTLPTGWDYEKEATSFTPSRMSLNPSGREIDFELSYGISLSRALRLQANILHQLEPGHDTSADAETSLLLQSKLEF